MRIAGAHLTYCTNIHAGESWPEVFENLRTHVVAVKGRVAPEQPFGVGLRLSARAARTLRQEENLPELVDFLRRHELYVFTINGFPYGPFHGQPVKAAVYQPDWSERERGRYTEDLAEILAALLPAGLPGSISTVPCGFKPHLREERRVAALTRQLLEQAAALYALERRTGKHIALALEPEPGCYLETTGETLDFFQGRLLSPESRRFLADRVGESAERAERILLAHVGVCLDTCHAAIEFEEADETLDRLSAAGVSIPKIQLSTGLRLRDPSREALEALRAFDEPVYLHQVVARTERGELLRCDDLPAAFEDEAARSAAEWRVHFHVPLYRAELGAFENTQSYLARVLERQRREAASTQLEVETYTWDVLPQRERAGSVVASIARELDWVRERLAP